jgi:CubicO group peptidase (beta-lactamase class C family)
VGLSHTIDLDTQRDQLEPVGYFRNALGPLRPAIPEAPGWYFADGELAMPVGDLLRWDISVMNESLLSHASYAAMESPTRLRNGLYSNYGLGLSVGAWNGRRMISHSGEVGGFVAWNAVLPDDHVAIAVLTNQEASPAAGMIGRAIATLLVPPTGAAAATDVTARAEQLARATLAGLQHGTIDPARFTDNAKFYFNRTALGDYASSLGKLGAIRSLHQTANFDRGGMTYRGFAVEFANGTMVNLSTFTVPDGRYEQFLVEPAE